MITILSSMLMLLLMQADWRAAADRYKASGDASAALAIVEKQQPRSSALEDETGFLLAALRRRPEAIARFR